MYRPLTVLLYWLLLCFLPIVIFKDGFLLTRQTLSDRADKLRADGASFDHLVVLLVDALRFDFVVAPKGGQPYHGHLPILTEYVRDKDALLYQFIADPPTTTMQRLKALTTGSLPTFIDMGNSFTSTKITEDNLIDQFKAAGFHLSFVGDDTWGGLYPTTFDAFHPYPSLNVHDLHTVDEGVFAHFNGTFQETVREHAKTVTIGHLLGVDHCGHRFGPAHPAMTAKLRQINSFVAETVLPSLPSKTLLVVMGDHGMNEQGDHGGDSALEVESTLFLYANGKRLARTGTPPSLPVQNAAGSATGHSAHRRVDQIDLVPTLATLFGVAIPFGNLGAVIPELFAPDRLEDAVAANLAQMTRYMSTLAATTGETLCPLPTATTVSEQYRAMRAILACARAAWAEYDVPKIAIGLLYLIWAVGMSFYVTATKELSMLLLLPGVVLSVVAFLLLPMPLLALLPALFIWAALCLVLSLRHLHVQRPIASLVPLAVMGMHALTPTSNSLIIFEDTFVHTLLQSCLLYALYINRAQAYQWLQLMVLLRLSTFFKTCREEQMPSGCQPWLSMTSKADVLWPLLVATVVSLYLYRQFLRKQLSALGRWALLAGQCGVLAHAQLYAIATEENGWGVYRVLVAQMTAGLLLLVGVTEKRRLFWAVALAQGMMLTHPPMGILAITSNLLLLLAWRARLSPPMAEQWAPVLASLLSHHIFFRIGHQAVLTSIQWPSAYTFHAGVVPVLNAAGLVLNYFGPFLLAHLVFHQQDALASWPVALSLMTLMQSLFVAHFRRHLMVWKVFAPRWMVAAAATLITPLIHLFASF